MTGKHVDKVLLSLLKLLRVFIVFFIEQLKQCQNLFLKRNDSFVNFLQWSTIQDIGQMSDTEAFIFKKLYHWTRIPPSLLVTAHLPLLCLLLQQESGG